MEMTVNKKKTLIITLALVGLAFVIYKGFGAFLNVFDLNYYLASVIKEVVFIAAIAAVAVILKKVYTLQFSKQGFGTGILTGIYLVIMSVISLCFGLYTALASDAITVNAWEFFLFAFNMALVGLAEELLFRGILQNAFHEYLGNASVKAVRLAILFAALFFGFCHVFNVFTGASLGGAAIQALCNIPMGMLFGAVYYRSRKNLWVCIILHGVYDFCVSIQGGALNGATIGNQVSNYSLMSFVMAGVVLLIAIFVTRGKKVRPLLDESEVADQNS